MRMNFARLVSVIVFSVLSIISFDNSAFAATFQCPPGSASTTSPVSITRRSVPATYSYSNTFSLDNDTMFQAVAIDFLKDSSDAVGIPGKFSELVNISTVGSLSVQEAVTNTNILPNQLTVPAGKVSLEVDGEILSTEGFVNEVQVTVCTFQP